MNLKLLHTPVYRQMTIIKKKNSPKDMVFLARVINSTWQNYACQLAKAKHSKAVQKKHPGGVLLPGRENMGKVFQRIDNMAHNTDPFGCAYPSVLMSGRMEGRRGRER